jgi:hypothetical protein
MTKRQKKIEWLTIADMDRLDPKEAGRRVMSEPENVLVTLPQIADLFGLSGDELMAELTSGRLIASGTETPGGWTDVHVTVLHLIEWAVQSNRVLPGELN